MSVTRIDPAAARRWGRTYKGQGDLYQAARILAHGVLAPGGFLCECHCFGDLVVIEATQKEPWHRIIRRKLPQKVNWIVQRSGNEIRITADFRLYGWFVVWMSALWLVSIGGFVAADWAVKQGWHLASGWTAAAVPALAIFSLGLIFWSASALSALGGRLSESSWQSFLEGFESCGGRLEPEGLGMSLRHGLSHFLLLLAGLCLAIAYFGVNGVDQILPRMDVASTLLILLALVGLLSLSAVFLLVRKGFSYRSTAILAGLGGTISVLFFLAAALIPLLGSMNAESFRSEVRAADAFLQRDLVAEGWARASAQRAVKSAQHRLTELRFLATLQWSAQMLVLAMSLFMFWTAVKASAAAHPVLSRMKKFQEQDVHREAISGKWQLRFFRSVFISVWALMAAFMAAALALVAACAAQALLPSISFPTQRPAELMAAMFAYIIGFSADNMTLKWIFRVGWILYFLFCLAAMVASVGQLALKRYAAFRSLASWSADGSQDEGRQLLKLTRQLADDMSAPRVELAVSDLPSPFAGSFCYGWIRKRRFVEVSRGFVRILPHPSLLQALIAHELAHHVLKHPQKDSRWRWLGRFTLAGDGFVRALQDSFDYEEKATARAERQGFTRSDFAVTQRKMRSVARFHDDPPPPPLPGGLRRLKGVMEALEAFPQASLEFEDVSKSTGWRASWRLFRQQFFCGFELHYWNPEYESAGAAEPARTQE